MVADVNLGTFASNPQGFERLGSYVYYAATTVEAGTELWRSNGTAEGTHLVADVWPGPTGSFPKWLKSANGTLFFTTFTFAGQGLWRSDGTPEGTVLLKDFPSVNFSVSVTGLEPVGATLFFGVQDGGGRAELWRSDGTVEGTVVALDLAAAGSSGPSGLRAFGSDLLFFGGTPSAPGLYRTDGTEDGTVLLHQFDNYVTAGLVPVGSLVFFGADAGDTGGELWRTDGTPGGTFMVEDVYAGPSSSQPTLITEFNGYAYFNAYIPYEGWRIWKSDGSPGGVEELLPGPDTGTLVTGLAVTPSGLAISGCRSTCGLWLTDGTAAGTTLIKDLEVNGSGSADYPQDLTAFGAGVIFTSGQTASGREVWLSDLTEEGTRLLLDAMPGSNSGASGAVPPQWGRRFGLLDGLAVVALNTPQYGNELWVTDGTPEGTALTVDAVADRTADSGPRGFTEMNGFVYFAATSTDGVRQIVRTPADSSGGVTPVTATPFEAFTQIRNLKAVGSSLYFVAPYPGSSTVLWKTDGTYGTETVVLDSLWVPFDSPDPVELNGQLVLAGNSADLGHELWRSDGTVSGTWPLTALDTAPGGNGVAWTPCLFDTGLVAAGGTVYFTAFRDAEGFELWKSDGTEAGTMLVKDIRGGTTGSEPCWLTPVGNRIFFTANDGVHGRELWVSDGTPAGTLLVRDIHPAGDSNPAYLANAAGRLYFAATEPTAGRELWMSDGTAVGTSVAVDLEPGPGHSNPNAIATVGRVAYFGTSHPALGGLGKLWRSDGTPGGTVPLYVGAPVVTVAVGQNVYFAPTVPGTGQELWMTRGTSASTRAVADIFPGSLSSSPLHLTAIGSRLFFAANDGVHGEEPWVATPPPDGDTPGDFTGDGLANRAIYRRATGTWWIDGVGATNLGLPGDVPVAGDYDGDAGSELAVFRPATGTWYIAGQAPIAFGQVGDVPVPADYDGDGVLDLAVFRPGSGQWLVRHHPARVWGQAGDLAVPGDYTGDGIAEVAVYRPSTGVWYVDGLAPATFGQPGDVPVPADYDGDGTLDVAVYRPATGTWYVHGQGARIFGEPSDVPVPLDVTGDGRAELLVWRPRTGVWYAYDLATSLLSAVAYGAPGDLPAEVRPQLARGRAFDADGDRRADPGVYRPSTQAWYLLRSASNFANALALGFGVPGAAPVSGDYDGDGRLDLATADAAAWAIRYSSTNYASGPTVAPPGGAGAQRVPGDYDGDGRTDVATFAAGTWTVRLSSQAFASGFTRVWGTAGDVPVVADYDGDGRSDLAVFRPGVGTWYVERSSTGAPLIRQWGASGDVPLARDVDGDFRADLVMYRSGAWYLLPSAAGWTTGQGLGVWGTGTDLPVVADYDGDGRAEVAVYRPGTGVWYVRDRFTVQWGAGGDVALPAP